MTRMALQRNHIRGLLIFAGWTAAGLISAGTEYFTGLAVNRPYPYSAAAWWNLAAFYLFAASLPAITFLARRFPFDRQRWLSRGLVYAAWIFVLSVLHLAAFLLIYWAIGGPRLPRGAPAEQAFDHFKLLFVGNLRTNLIMYALLLFGVMATNYYRRYLAGEQRAAQLQAQLAQAQLQALKMQLHPHFLFNTLNAISELVHKEPETAERMVIQLSDMLRVSLDGIGVQEIPLKQELEFLRRYLDIEETRFRDRLKIRMDVEPETLGAYVPNMILQPLVENAIRHGISPLSRGGSIDIRARRNGETLQLQICDDGRGLPANGENGSHGNGVGLTNTRARLTQLYGAGRFELNVESVPDAGVAVSVTIPLREERDGYDTNADR
jgi:two-component system, LytTR family, sensor kinase